MTKQKNGLFGVAIGAVLAVGGMVAASCDGGKKKEATATEEEPFQIIEVEELPSIIEKTGVIGNGTTMNVMELIGTEGDTTYIDVNSAAVRGGVKVGDEVQVVYNSSDKANIAHIAINVSSLLHLWTQKGDDGRTQSLELNSGGRASTYNMRIEYNSWELKDGLLMLHSPRKVGTEEPEKVDSFEIMELTDDRLVLMYGNLVSEFECEN